VTVDPAPGMGADVVARAEDLPFAGGSFDVVTCRIAPHHFDDVRAAVREMARVSRDRVVIEDNVYRGDHVEEAEKLRDPTHVRCYSEDEWRDFFADAGLGVEATEWFERRQDFEAWMARVETPEEDARRVRELLADEVVDGMVGFRSIVLKGRKVTS